MTIDNIAESEKYQPAVVKKLLIAELPPPSGSTYFYAAPKLDSYFSKNKIPIEKDSRLSSTIFHHYFKKRPENAKEYLRSLRRLKKRKIFLIDISDKPLKINDRKFKRHRNPYALKELISEIPKLRDKIKNRCGIVDDKDIIFLLARNDYKRELKSKFLNSKYEGWKKFRMRQN